jgi:hypothetical protein
VRAFESSFASVWLLFPFVFCLTKGFLLFRVLFDKGVFIGSAAPRHPLQQFHAGNVQTVSLVFWQRCQLSMDQIIHFAEAGTL